MLYDNKDLLIKYLMISLVILLIYLSYLMLKPFLSFILIALLIVYVLYPINTKLSKILKNKTISAVVLTLFVLAILILPLAFLGNVLVKEVVVLYDRLDVNSIESTISGLSNGNLDSYVGPFIQKVLTFLVNEASNFIFALPTILMGLLIALAVTFFAFKEGNVLANKIKSILPLKASEKEKVILKFKKTMDATIYGTIAMAVVEGVIATFLFWIFGIPTPLLWGILTAAISMLPFLGPAVVWLPASIYLYFTGHMMAGFSLFLLSLLIITLTIDIFLKNKIIGKKGEIHPIVVLLGVIGGVSVFGVVGLIIGPFVLSLLIFIIGLIFDQNGIKSKKHKY